MNKMNPHQLIGKCGYCEEEIYNDSFSNDEYFEVCMMAVGVLKTKNGGDFFICEKCQKKNQKEAKEFENNLSILFKRK